MQSENWIRAARSYSPQKFWELLNYYRTVEEIPLNSKYSMTDFTREQKIADELDCRWLCAYEPAYPAALKQIVNPPPVLLMKGNLEILQKEAVSISGARNCSQASATFVFKVAEYCGKFGYPIVSGLAVGIDSAAHYGSLNSGTIAILPGGFTEVFPSQNKELYYKILETGGAILSANMIDAHITKKSFDPRNNIIAAYGKILVLADAAEKSGSLITARYALDYGREIFVVPGHPADPRSEGGNRIIQNGGNLLQSLNDLNEILNIRNKKVEEDIEKDIEKDGRVNEANIVNIETQVLNLITIAPINIEVLADTINISTHKLRSLLTELELDEKILINKIGEVSKLI